MTADDARHQVRLLLMAERSKELDRDDRFLPVIESIVND
jgi:hypothetical protein